MANFLLYKGTFFISTVVARFVSVDPLSAKVGDVVSIEIHKAADAALDNQLISPIL